MHRFVGKPGNRNLPKVQTQSSCWDADNFCKYNKLLLVWTFVAEH